MAQLRQPPSSPPVRATQARAAELRKRLDGASGLAPRLTLDDPLPPPVNRQAVTAAEDRLGFALPSLLARLWAEVANGGFGPGYGLFGLEGGHVDDASRQPLPDLLYRCHRGFFLGALPRRDLAGETRAYLRLGMPPSVRH
jgi:hypothetical protein